MKVKSVVARTISFMALVALTTGCGVELDTPGEVATLRVLGVQKDKPYPAPGDSVTLSALWHNAIGEPSNVQFGWLGGCWNPPGDSYFGCFQNFSEALSGGTPPSFSFGDQFTLDVPDDIVTSRPPPKDPRLPPFGFGVVFFAACDGTLEFARPTNDGGLPLKCFDPKGEERGPDHFVAGYTQMYVYEEFENKNPVISGIRFNGQDVTPDCIGIDCLTTPIQQPDCQGSVQNPLCVQVCPSGDECEFEIKPAIERESAEVDTVSTQAQGRPGIREQAWVQYHTERGDLSSQLKLVNDATKGWNDEYQVKLTLKTSDDKGANTIWAVVRDNRGGQQWVRLTIGLF